MKNKEKMMIKIEEGLKNEYNTFDENGKRKTSYRKMASKYNVSITWLYKKINK